MPELAVGGKAGTETRHFDIDLVSRVAIAVLFVVLLVISLTQNVNWDEFYFLSHVHAFLDGRLDRPLQTFFVHGFGWLDLIPGQEMEQILAARLVMLGFLGVTAYSIYRIASHFTDRSCAKIAVFAFLASGFVIPHGASFRADPIAAALLTSSIAVILTTRMTLPFILLTACLSALAVLVTIKSSLYLPAYLAAFIWRMNEKGMALRILSAGATALVLCGLLYTWHASGIEVSAGKDAASNAHNALTTTLLQSDLFPRSTEIKNWLIFSVPQLVLVGLGLTAIREPRRILLLLLLCAPFFSIVIYRNAYPYFFPFIIPLMMVVVAIGAQRIHKPWVRLQMLMLIAVTAGLQTAILPPKGVDAQRATIAEVHRLFDQPVPYIDESGMIASFPSAGFFMSSWGIANYRADGEPVFADLIRNTQPPLLIAGKGGLQQTMWQMPDDNTPPVLLPADHQVLRDSYVHYAGPIWLAGRDVTLSDGTELLDLPFAGAYRIETTEPVILNGQPSNDGDRFTFDQTTLSLSGAPGTQVKVIWDTGVPPIPADSIPANIFVGFLMLSL